MRRGTRAASRHAILQSGCCSARPFVQRLLDRLDHQVECRCSQGTSFVSALANMTASRMELSPTPTANHRRGRVITRALYSAPSRKKRWLSSAKLVGSISDQPSNPSLIRPKPRSKCDLEQIRKRHRQAHRCHPRAAIAGLTRERADQEQRAAGVGDHAAADGDIVKQAGRGVGPAPAVCVRRSGGKSGGPGREDPRRSATR